ncbi:MAG: hypothetical protein H6618_05065, partial [Deltaproteobacteria bacterium]|nr:hypothetical protein [Deltaproteobacteria bacterium]
GEYESYATALGEKLDLDFSEILNMKSFSRDGAKVSDTEKFPVVFFTTGDNSSVQKYENLITNTVSHGYIVVGINSPFLSGDNLLPTGHVIKTSKAKNDDLDHNVRSDDIFYIQKNIHKIGQVYDVMILNKLSIIGHSAGANAVAKIIESKDHPFSAAIAMDADVRENFQGFEIPFLHELAATRYWGTKYGAPAARVSFTPKYILKDNNYLVAIVESKDNLLNAHPDGPLYSHHTSFTDVATLLKSEPFQEALPTLEKLVELIFGHPFQSPLGDGDGQEIAAIMNLYVVDFLNFYIKGTKSSIFGSSNCHAIIDKSIASCGPVIFP